MYSESEGGTYKWWTNTYQVTCLSDSNNLKVLMFCSKKFLKHRPDVLCFLVFAYVNFIHQPAPAVQSLITGSDCYFNTVSVSGNFFVTSHLALQSNVSVLHCLVLACTKIRVASINRYSIFQSNKTKCWRFTWPHSGTQLPLCVVTGISMKHNGPKGFILVGQTEGILIIE